MVYINYINEIYRDKSLEKRLMTDVTGYIKKDDIKVFNVYTEDMEVLKLSSLQKFLLSTRGFVRVDKRKYPNWTGKLPFYIYKCQLDKEEFFLDYPHGYKKRLDC